MEQGAARLLRLDRKLVLDLLRLNLLRGDWRAGEVSHRAPSSFGRPEHGHLPSRARAPQPPNSWYQVSSPVKLTMDRLVCADGGNPDPTRTNGKDAKRAKEIVSHDELDADNAVQEGVRNDARTLAEGVIAHGKGAWSELTTD